ncbi:phage distal tail protein [Pseudarthrobacter cellobiosi]|uniref:phage distal tail protein n=1 Tax=Pseudarthrobacter cellobiosi TaxID=2953654 RepID=UPI00208E53A3|nr:phage tail domain-containing protein [Pseudarthrobacter sp. HLT1-5]MCO4257418.1 phage tail family protein [Pseudarthrobacter sp. HLT1-5]
MSAVVFAAVTLSQYQVYFSSTSTILGAGTDVGLINISGLRDLPAIRQGNVNRGQRDSMWPGLNFVGERTVRINYQITKTSEATETTLRTVTAAHQNVIDPATICMTAGDYLRQKSGTGAVKPIYSGMVQLPNRANPLIFFGRPVRFGAPIDNDFQYGRVDISTEWSCPDGLLYDNAIISGQCGLPNPTSGATFPLTFDVTFGSSSGGSFQMDNTGAYTTAPFFTITGPVSYPIITNQATGEQIKLNIAIGAGDKLTVDCQSGTVTLNGANRNTTVDITTTFFGLLPGVNTIGFASSDSAAVTSQLTGYALPAYSVA